MRIRVYWVNVAKVQTLRSDFEAIRIKGGESMDDFFMKLNIISTCILFLGETKLRRLR